MKKILISVSVFVLLGVLLTLGTIAHASGDCEIYLSNYEAQPGDTLQIDVYIKNNPGISFLRLTPRTSDGITITKVENGSIINDLDVGTNLVWSADNDSNENGLLVSFSVKIDDNAELGEHLFKLIFKECYDFDLNDIDIVVSECVINVYGYHKVTWENYDGSVLKMDTSVKTGVLPQYSGETPTRAGDALYYYVFTGWTPDILPVNADVTYTALFEMKERQSETTEADLTSAVSETNETTGNGKTSSDNETNESTSVQNTEYVDQSSKTNVVLIVLVIILGLAVTRP